MIDTPVWSDEMVARAGIPIVDIPFVTVGGGIGSFVMVDHLRIAGVPANQLAVLGVNDHPWDTYEYLTRVSQVPRGERLRSDAGSNPDNIWGFPSYAMREAWAAKKGFVATATGVKKQSTVGAKLAPIYNVLTEPILTDYFTPRAGQAFAGMEREAARIGYNQMLRKGLVRMVRRRQGAGYFTILTPAEGTSATKRVAFRSRFVHIAVGYPGLRFLPDLQEYRTRTQDYVHVVNAYEPHEHVYDELVRRPCTVVIRGGGIVASRVLQRIIDDRNLKGAQTNIIHLLRNYLPARHGPSVYEASQGSVRHRHPGLQLAEVELGRGLQEPARKGDAGGAQGAAELAGRHDHAAPQALAAAAGRRREGRLLPSARRVRSRRFSRLRTAGSSRS